MSYNKLAYNIYHNFDSQKCRHYINGFLSVLHCHHYTTLYTQLAIDAKETDLFKNVCEENFYEVLKSYFEENNVQCPSKMLEIGLDYYSKIGLGKLEVGFIGENSGEFFSKNAHVEEGWIKKWGKYDKPVNYIGAGFIAALFSLMFHKCISVFEVVETESIVKGNDKTCFKIYKK